MKDLWDYHCMNRYYENKKPNVVVFAVEVLQSLRACVVCRVRGHDLIDEGYASPESGCIEITCKRCGHSYGRHYLY